MGNVVLGHSFIKIKWHWGNFFPKKGKWLTPTIMDKKVSCSNSSLKLWIKICHWLNASEKLQERSCISCGNDTKIYHKSFPKASKGVFTIAYLIWIFQCFPVFSSQQGL